MPTVRKYDRQVGVNALPGVRQTAAETPTSEGADLALARGRGRAAVLDAVGNLGGVASRVGTQLFGELADRAREDADQTALLAASNKLAEWKSSALYDPEHGAFAQQGENAFHLPETIKASFQQTAGEIGKGLATPKQRKAFAHLVSTEWQSTDLQVRRHVFGEMQQFRAGELKATIAHASDDAIRSAEDPLLVGQNLAKATDAIKANGPRLGMGPEAVDAQVRQVQSGVHVGVISQLLSLEKDQKASDYFAATKGQIAADHLDDVQRALEEGTVRGTAQRTADAILAKGGTLTEQLAQAKDLEPKLREHVEARLEHAELVKDRAAKEREEVSMRGAFDILDKTADVNKIPPAQWASFTGPVRASMRAYATNRAKGTPIETDYPTYYALMQQAADDPGAFVGQNLLNYRGKLDDGEFKQLAGLQLSIKSSDAKRSEHDLAGFRTKSELVNDALTQYGIDPKAKPESDEGKAIAQLRRMLDRRIDAAQQDGKKASNTEIQGALDELLGASVKVPGSWWNIFPGGKPFFDETKPLVYTTAQDIPALERTHIERALRDNGRPVTDATVLDLWIEMTYRRSKR